MFLFGLAEPLGYKLRAAPLSPESIERLRTQAVSEKQSEHTALAAASVGIKRFGRRLSYFTSLQLTKDLLRVLEPLGQVWNGATGVRDFLAETKVFVFCVPLLQSAL